MITYSLSKIIDSLILCEYNNDNERIITNLINFLTEGRRLHWFEKKSNNTPTKELERARKEALAWVKTKN